MIHMSGLQTGPPSNSMSEWRQRFQSDPAPPHSLSLKLVTQQNKQTLCLPEIWQRFSDRPTQASTFTGEKGESEKEQWQI